jgi:hypothetical protein
MLKHLTDKIPHPQSIRTELSDRFCAIISKLVTHDRKDRYANLSDAALDMEGMLAGANR